MLDKTAIIAMTLKDIAERLLGAARKDANTLEPRGGSCEIRTHGGLTSSPVFKTGALNRSAKLPWAGILADGKTGAAMQAFYSDQFVLPLPPGHRFPMVKYAMLRNTVVEMGLTTSVTTYLTFTLNTQSSRHPLESGAERFWLLICLASGRFQASCRIYFGLSGCFS